MRRLEYPLPAGERRQLPLQLRYPRRRHQQADRGEIRVQRLVPYIAPSWGSPASSAIARVRVQMTGFAPDSRLDGWLFSEPVLLGQITTDSTGAALGHRPAPAELPIGQHSLQRNGITASGAA